MRQTLSGKRERNRSHQMNQRKAMFRKFHPLGGLLLKLSRSLGGGERHSLIVEHQLRPLFGFFEALTMPTAIYASDRDFANGILISETIRARSQQAVAEACRASGVPTSISLAA